MPYTYMQHIVNHIKSEIDNLRFSNLLAIFSKTNRSILTHISMIFMYLNNKGTSSKTQQKTAHLKPFLTF